ncbi:MULTISPECIES: RidA family protein [Nitrospirillum]|uniref:Enamine deaminase RidA (YjgF/YER057c/UK114 family) n=1 Tax=Nitrospirillum amazonense TaxID=28077 RepID=A0A560F566_9PROT|nr:MULTISPECIES: RidA family protein [Nitrospirillum]MDZ5647778.1 RidA family protein [Nitrospirillum sp. BR 11828]TWB16761.1 enamine deaminase RidA (YjgF/YER057c/UK114 family) [Nitrospirillum amazonense]
MGRQKVEVASAWGEAIGYSRAVKAGDLIFVSGTTASGGPDGKAFHPGDAGGQAKVILERIVAALAELGAGPEHVVETRIYLTDMSTWQDVGRAHGAVFGGAKPATTIVQVGPLISPDLLVEISATASLAE